MNAESKDAHSIRLEGHGLVDDKSRRKGIIQSLGKSPWIHRLISLLGIYQSANFLLGKWPIPRRRPLGGVYRLTSVASFALAEEMFTPNGCYQQALEGHSIETFVDLGCNSGWFPVLIREANPDANLTGILIDADPAMVEESQWHLRENKMTQCIALLGVVGCPAGQTEAIFYVNPASTQSSVKPMASGHPFPLKGKLREVRVPCLSLAREWTERFGSRRIDLLKIDIEGSELDFIQSEIAFLQSRVSRIVCEWHAWHVSFDDIRSYLQQRGFDLVVIAETDTTGGVAIFDRSVDSTATQNS